MNVCSIFGSPEDGQDVEEEVDDVQVEVESGEDVLLRAERVLVLAPEHQLGVVHDVQREDDGPHRGVADLGVTGMEDTYYMLVSHYCYTVDFDLPSARDKCKE